VSGLSPERVSTTGVCWPMVAEGSGRSAVDGARSGALAVGATARRGDVFVPADGLSSVAADRQLLRRVLQAAGRGDADAVHGILEELLVDGWTPATVVTRLLVGVAEGIGRRWQDGRWTVAQEHVAMAIVDTELVLLAQALPAPSLDVEVMVACAEGEWHITPARMAALLLREHGFRVRFVGGSVPADQLDRTLAQDPPDFLAVSCTYPLSLAGAATIATVARRHRIPTLAGGHGFGANPHRASRLGLTGWTPSVHEGAQRLLAWHAGPRPVGGAHAPEIDLEELEDRWWAMADEVLERLQSADHLMVSEGRPLAPLRQDLTDLLKAAHLTALCEDPTLFTDHLDWLQATPGHRGLPPEAIASTIEILRELVGVYEPTDAERTTSGGDGTEVSAVGRRWATPVADTTSTLSQSALIARTLIEVEDTELLCQRLVNLLVDVVEGCDHVGFIILEHGERVAARASSPQARVLEELEREVGEGPCTEALERRTVIEGVDLGTERRWPTFAPMAVESTPVRGVLAVPLIIRGQLLGVLALLADAAGPYSSDDRLVAEGFATHAAIALHAAIQQRTLVEAIRTRDVIGQAKGILMVREGVDDERAFELLRAMSNRTNTKLRDVAASIVRRQQ
jgi:methanogenic corrinoid protein MtbC1/GAF domain-containing protein